jgi:hypothetical protein
MVNKIKIICEIIKLQFKIWKLDIDIWQQKQQWKNNDGTYTQVCLKCHEPNKYQFYGNIPNKHICNHCGSIF